MTKSPSCFVPVFYSLFQPIMYSIGPSTRLQHGCIQNRTRPNTCASVGQTRSPKFLTGWRWIWAELTIHHYWYSPIRRPRNKRQKASLAHGNCFVRRNNYYWHERRLKKMGDCKFCNMNGGTSARTRELMILFIDTFFILMFCAFPFDTGMKCSVANT